MGTMIERFASLIGLPKQRAEEGLVCEREAKAFLLTRRTFLGVAGAAAAVTSLEPVRVFSFAKPAPMSAVHLKLDGRIIHRWYPGDSIRGFDVGLPTVPRTLIDEPKPVRIGKVQLVSVQSGLIYFQTCIAEGTGFRWQAQPDDVILVR